MTALKPIENRRVRAVASERYPLNAKCAHPECGEDTADPHHAFPRSAIGGDSWFVAIHHGDEAGITANTEIIPHVTGLCREHHRLVEEHLSWIKLEDGEWRWYERNDGNHENAWDFMGPLNPQPGSREGKPKKRRFKGEARRKRRVVSIRVPNDAVEDGAALLDEALEEVEAKIQGDQPHRPPYYTILNALDYVLLNADETDFV